jgi:parallel beta-helix repeat protein
LNCQFIDNTHAAIDAIHADNNNNVVEGCTLRNNGGYGIYLAGSQENEIQDCVFQKSKLMSVDTQDTQLIDSSVDSIYLLDQSSLQMINCKNVHIANIKAIDSVYDIVDDSDCGNRNLLENRDPQFHLIRSRFLNFVNLIRMKIRSYLVK